MERKGKAGRPRVEIDFEITSKLGEIYYTIKECSAVIGIAESTLQGELIFE